MSADILVVVPTYERTELLLRAVESAFDAGSEHVRVRVVVVDNCSSVSPSSALVARFGDRVQLHVNDRNLGITGNWNRCVTLAQASGADAWVMLEDDNLLEPGFLSAGVAALEADRSADVFFSACTEFDENGKETAWRMWSVSGGWLRSGSLPSPELLAWSFTCAMRVSGVLVRNAPHLVGLPRYSEDCYAVQDVPGLCELALAARSVVYDERPLMRYFLNPRGISTLATGQRSLLFSELARALRENARRLVGSRLYAREDWRRAAAAAPVDRLLMAVLALEPRAAPDLAMPHAALVDQLVLRSHELSGWKRHASSALGAAFWRMACLLTRSRRALRRPTFALAPR